MRRTRWPLGIQLCLLAACAAPMDDGRVDSRAESASLLEVPLFQRGGISLSQGESAWFYVDVPEPAARVRISIEGDNGVADLYTRFEQRPTRDDHDCAPLTWGSNETCEYAPGAAGRYWVWIRAYRSFRDLQLRSSYEPRLPRPLPPPTGGGATELDETDLTVATRGGQVAYAIDVPAGAASLDVQIAGGSGDADLYVNYGEPSVDRFTVDCAPYRAGNNETCSFANPRAGRWHIVVRAYSAFAGVALTARSALPDNDPSQIDCSFEKPVRWTGYGSEVRNVLSSVIYAGRRTTFYCGCSYDDSARVDHASCGYSAPAAASSGSRDQNWEHIVAAYRMNIGRPCRTQCSNMGARDCCRENDIEFRMMEGDLHNLAPAINQVNSLRGSKDFGLIAGEHRAFGECDFEYDNDTAEPGPGVRGDIARVFFYMEATYEGFELTDAERALFEVWNDADPVDEAEAIRNERILAYQGNSNPFVDAGLSGATCR